MPLQTPQQQIIECNRFTAKQFGSPCNYPDHELFHEQSQRELIQREIANITGQRPVADPNVERLLVMLNKVV